jgi:hypothetical protein
LAPDDVPNKKAEADEDKNDEVELAYGTRITVRIIL